MSLLRFFLIIFFLLTNYVFAFDSSMPQNSSDWSKKVQRLNWKPGPTTIDYFKGNAKIKVERNYEYLEKEDANQYLYWANGVKFNTDYLILTDNAQYSVYYHNDGYVKIDDWKDVNPDKFLKELLENARESNKERARNNQSTIKDMRWFKQPTLDRSRDAVYYALNITWSDNSETINSSVILLGRSGYAKINVSTNANKYREYIVTNVPNIYTFNDNQKYSNFTTGDKVAAAGVGALVAGSLGIKTFAKAGGAVGIFLLLKKFGVFLLALPLLFFRKIFGGGEAKQEEYIDNSNNTNTTEEKKEPKKTTKKKK